MPRKVSLREQRRATIRPGAGLLELRRDPDQQALGAERTDQLDRRRGAPSSVQCSGTEIAGWPVALKIPEKAPVGQARRIAAIGSGPESS